MTVGEGSIDYREFDDRAARLAGYLVSTGVKAGDKVAIHMHNRPEWLIALFAAFKIGAAPVPINFRYRPAEVDVLLDDSEAVALIYPASLVDVESELEETKKRTIALVQVQDIEDGVLVDGAVTYDEALQSEPYRPAQQPADGELFIYTGGTTGRPKGVVWGVAEMLDIQTFPAYGSLGITPPETMQGMVDIAVDESMPHPVTLPLAPFLHGTALTTTLNTFLVGGAIVVVPSSRFDPDLAVSALRDFGVTRLIVAGDSVANLVLDALQAHNVTSLPTLTSIMSSGMRFGDETKRKLHGLNRLTITDILASSEGGPYALGISNSADEIPARLVMTPKTVLFDPDHNLVPIEPGAVGILAFGGSLPKGYYRDPKKSEETFPLINGHRYVMPGDFARVLEDGSIELLGRGSSVVNSGGEKIYPSEVEEVLMTHPEVVDAVVFGTPHPTWGEAVTAAVAVTGGSTVTVADLQDFVGAQLAGYKKPRTILIRSSLERSPSGKVDITALKSAALEEGSK
jgi:fatty-acyl-CoA synthase